mmetsp:Transcript_2831/g.8152  ORF Transcript_2831/g.8152 Transcript_2831/m.8152 type:complete len:231 (-) Transcript_2831:110-802(-)
MSVGYLRTNLGARQRVESARQPRGLLCLLHYRLGHGLAELLRAHAVERLRRALGENPLARCVGHKRRHGDDSDGADDDGGKHEACGDAEILVGGLGSEARVRGREAAEARIVVVIQLVEVITCAVATHVRAVGARVDGWDLDEAEVRTRRRERDLRLVTLELIHGILVIRVALTHAEEGPLDGFGWEEADDENVVVLKEVCVRVERFAHPNHVGAVEIELGATPVARAAH